MTGMPLRTVLFTAGLGTPQLTTRQPCAFAGGLPASWGSSGAFPLLEQMYFDHVNLNGSLQAEWGSPDSFQQLLNLYTRNQDPHYYDTRMYSDGIGGEVGLWRQPTVPMPEHHFQCLPVARSHLWAA